MGFSRIIGPRSFLGPGRRGDGSLHAVLDSFWSMAVVDHQTKSTAGRLVCFRGLWLIQPIALHPVKVINAMKSMKRVFRRTHLYLGMFLIPWLFVYAFSAFLVNHGDVFRKMRLGPDAWNPVWEKTYSIDLPQEQAALREWAEELLENEGLSTARFGVNRNAQRTLITSQRFLNPVRVTYRFSDSRLIAEKREGS